MRKSSPPHHLGVSCAEDAHGAVGTHKREALSWIFHWRGGGGDGYRGWSKVPQHTDLQVPEIPAFLLLLE